MTLKSISRTKDGAEVSLPALAMTLVGCGHFLKGPNNKKLLMERMLMKFLRICGMKKSDLFAPEHFKTII